MGCSEEELRGVRDANSLNGLVVMREKLAEIFFLSKEEAKCQRRPPSR